MIENAPEYYYYRDGENVRIFGLKAAQNRLAFEGFSILLDLIRPKNIVELGSGYGALTLLVGIWAKLEGASVLAYERGVKDQQLIGLYGPLGIDMRHEDYAQGTSPQTIVDFIQRPGVTLMICDGGDKPAELAQFGPHLKTGDYIGCHDYWADKVKINQYWGWCEASLDSVKDLPLEPVYQELMRYGAWGMFRKVEK